MLQDVTADSCLDRDHDRKACHIAIIATLLLEECVAEPQIRFDDGAAYERMMGGWSRLAGDIFIDWLAPSRGLRWIDVGCGNGAFTERIVERCAPAAVEGVDPSPGQLAFARTRPAARVAVFREGDAMALPFAAERFDVAIMALVIFFVPDPAKAVAEMARVVRSGGTVAAYAWDMHGGGFPLEPILIEMRAMGITPVQPPSTDASRIETMRQLWRTADITAVETREISVQRSFADFEDFWAVALLSPAQGRTIAAMAPSDREMLKARTRARMPADASGRITHEARANAIKGCRRN
jgi:ubiquinone/menaquinone biosynthesis C-methylase UbiE